MKREQFLITSTDGHNVTKTKWNASIRCVEELIRAVARAEDAYYELVDSVSNKEGFNHTNGTRTWSSTGGKVVVFTIQKVA